MDIGAFFLLVDIMASSVAHVCVTVCERTYELDETNAASAQWSII